MLTAAQTNEQTGRHQNKCLNIRKGRKRQEQVDRQTDGQKDRGIKLGIDYIIIQITIIAKTLLLSKLTAEYSPR